MQAVLPHFKARGTGHVINVATVIVEVIRTRKPDVYTRHGARDRVLGYLAGLAEDPQS